MFTYIKMSAEEFNDKLSEGQDFSIVVPQDDFEISLLHKVLIDELHLMFEGKITAYDKFDTLCNYIYYDGNGRFFFDLSEDPKCSNDKIAFYIAVYGSSELEFDEEGEFIDPPPEDMNLVSYDVMEDDVLSTEDREYSFEIYSHHKGLMKIDLRETIGLMMSNTIKKI